MARPVALDPVQKMPQIQAWYERTDFATMPGIQESAPRTGARRVQGPSVLFKMKQFYVGGVYGVSEFSCLFNFSVTVL